jgi:hypothetical protein
MPRINKLWATAAAVSVALALASSFEGVVAAAAAPQAAASTGAAQDPDDAAAVQLALDHAIPLDQARARIQEQTAFDKLSASAAQAAASFGGAWIDQDDTGRLVIQLSDMREAGAVQQLAAQSGMASRVRIDRVVLSVAQLQALQKDVTDDLATAAGAAAGDAVGLDVMTNTVHLNVPAEARTAAQKAFDAHLVNRFAGKVHLTREGNGGGQAGCIYTSNGPACDPPLRGGQALLRTDATHTLCSIGFYARSNSDNWPYYITAAHCMRDNMSAPWAYRNTGSTTNNVFGTSWNQFYGAGGDAGIVRVNSGTLPSYANYVYVAPNGGAYPTTYSDSYTILGDGNVGTVPTGGNPAGKYLCHTGAGLAGFGYPETKCGILGQTNVTKYFAEEPFAAVTQLAEFHNSSGVLGCKGDSGGPVFVNHTAFGIITGGEGSSYATYNNGICNGMMYYTGIGTIMNNLNVHVMHTP